MLPETTPTLERFLIDWSVTLAIGGFACLLVGIVVGWIIWKNTRRFTVTIEDRNREALAEYERTSDEVSKIKAELSTSEERSGE